MKQNRYPVPLALVASISMTFMIVVMVVWDLASHRWFTAVALTVGLFAWISMVRRAERRYHRRWLQWHGQADVFPRCPVCETRPGAAHLASCFIPEITRQENVWSGEWPTVSAEKKGAE